MKDPWKSTQRVSAPHDSGRTMWLADASARGWGGGRLQLRWPICEAPAGANAATYLCVPAERRSYLLQLSGVHLERQLIRLGEWGVEGEPILANSPRYKFNYPLHACLRVSFALSLSLSLSHSFSPQPFPFSLFSTQIAQFFCSLFWEIVLFFLFFLIPLLLHNNVSRCRRADFSLSGKKKRRVLCLILEYVTECLKKNNTSIIVKFWKMRCNDIRRQVFSYLRLHHIAADTTTSQSKEKSLEQKKKLKES